MVRRIMGSWLVAARSPGAALARSGACLDPPAPTTADATSGRGGRAPAARRGAGSIRAAVSRAPVICGPARGAASLGRTRAAGARRFRPARWATRGSVAAWTVASRPPAPWVVAAVGLGAAIGADAAAAWVRPASLAPLAYVTAAAFIAGVLGQLSRPAGRVRVTESLASTLVVVLGVVAFATLVVLTRHPGGTQAIVACLVAAGVSLVVARLTDIVLPFPRLAPQVPRGGTGVVLGAMAGTAAAAVAGYYLQGLQTSQTAIAGLVTAVVAVVVDLSVGYAEASRQLAGETSALWLARNLQGPLGSFALAAPAVYAASALLLVSAL